jgi:hypothetical protein
MLLRQISVFLENKQGRLAAVTKNLSDAGINIRALALADTERFGILRIIADNTEAAVTALKNAGVTAKVSEVVGVEVPDKAGGLATILTLFEEASVSLEYMYAQVQGRGDKAILIMKLAPAQRAIEVLSTSGMQLVGEEGLC